MGLFFYAADIIYCLLPFPAPLMFRNVQRERREGAGRGVGGWGDTMTPLFTRRKTPSESASV